MTDVLRRIDCLSHGAHRDGLNQVGFRLTLHLCEQLINVLRYGLLARASGLERITKATNKLTEIQ